MKVVFFFKQKTAYEIRNCDWSSDVCSSDLAWPGSYLVLVLVLLRSLHVSVILEKKGSLLQRIRDRKSVV